MKKRDIKAEECWWKIMTREKISNLTKEYRKKLEIPENGFGDKSTMISFLKNIPKDKYKYVGEYISECKKDMEIIEKFRFYMIEYLITGKRYGVISANLTGCELSLENLKKEGTIDIKIGFNSSLEDIKEFIERKYSFIKAMQREYKKENKLPPKKRIRISPNKERDNVIYHLSKKFSSNELKELLKEKNPEIENMNYLYKEDMIKRIIKNIFNINVNGETIKMVIARQKKMRER